MIIGLILLFFVFLFSLRAVITIGYSDELSLSLRVLFIKIKLLPKKKSGKRVRSMSKKKSEKIKLKKQQKADKKAEKKRLSKQKKDEEKRQKKKEKKSIGEIIDTVDLVLVLVKVILKRFFGHLRVDVARFRIKVATPDPATTAIAYGTVSQTVAYLFEILRNNKNVRGLQKADIDISTDFLSDTPTADIKLAFSLRVWHVFHIALSALASLIKKKISQQQKADRSGAAQAHKFENNKK